MAARLHLDRLDGARLDNGTATRTHVRAAVVTDIDVNEINGADPNVLVKALAASGMPQIGDLHPSKDGTRVVRHLIEPISNNAAKVLIFYGLLNDFSGGETNFYLRDTSVSQAVQSQMIPGWLNPQQKPTGGYQAVVSWTDPLTKKKIIDEKPGAFTYQQPMRTVQACSRFVKRSTVNTLSSAQGCVNSKPWFDKPAGYWLLDLVEADSQYRNGGPYSCTVTFRSKNFEPWFVTLVSANNGNFVRADDGELTKARQATYFYGQKQFNGFTLIGPYPTYDFSRLPLIGSLGGGSGFSLGVPPGTNLSGSGL